MKKFKPVGVNVSLIDGEITVIHGLHSMPSSHRDVVENGMILTMVHEINQVIKHYRRFTEQVTVLNNKEKDE
jgi:predicted esterase YcpF (UPF0227 family)